MRWNRIITEKATGVSRQNPHDLFTTHEEVNTLYSLQRATSLIIAEWLNDVVPRQGGKRIVDLGCGAGVLAGWFAKTLPGSEVVGVDGVEHLVEISRKSQQVPNLSFQHWDYWQPAPESLGRFDSLYSCLGIEFENLPHTPWTPSFQTLREGCQYQSKRRWVSPLLRNWRAVASDNAVLHTVLRLGDVISFLAVVDAAAESGWQLDCDSFTKLRTDNSMFPALTFQPAPSAATPLPEDQLLALWGVDSIRTIAEFRDSAALLLFNSFAGKQILADQTQAFDDGHVMRSLVGTTPQFAFQYSKATTGMFGLKLYPLADAGKLKPQFEWRSPMEKMLYGDEELENW
jgi:hypothetical protein